MEASHQQYTCNYPAAALRQFKKNHARFSEITTTCNDAPAKDCHTQRTTKWPTAPNAATTNGAIMQPESALRATAARTIHDFNNLLMVIRGCSELLDLHKNDPAQVEKYARRIQEATRVAASMLSSFAPASGEGCRDVAEGKGGPTMP